MSFGSSPDADCMLLSDEPLAFLRDLSSSADGDCALFDWDFFNATLTNATAHNDALEHTERLEQERLVQERLELSAANAAPSASLWDEWRLVIIALHPLVMFVLLYIGDKLSVVKKKSSTSENLAAVTPVLDTFTSPPTAPPSTTQSSNLADSLSFNGFYGFTGVFVAVALLATGVLALYHANLAIHTAGKYSILMVLGSEMMEVVVQSDNANKIAKIWEKQGVRDWIGYDKYVEALGKDKVVEIV
ncbi:hypothetical protein TeGR_g12023, partial [Tetraparma gracilis]